MNKFPLLQGLALTTSRCASPLLGYELFRDSDTSFACRHQLVPHTQGALGQEPPHGWRTGEVA